MVTVPKMSSVPLGSMISLPKTYKAPPVPSLRCPITSKVAPSAIVYESPSFVKKERTMGASVNLPFVYPSIGASLAPVGCFEVALAAPSVIRAQGPVGIRARQHQHGITVACGVLSILSFEAL